MTDREIWLKAMEIVETHGVLDATAAIGTLIRILGAEFRSSDWLRVFTAVDQIAGCTCQ